MSDKTNNSNSHNGETIGSHQIKRPNAMLAFFKTQKSQYDEKKQEHYQKKYEELQKEFRRLSIGKAELCIRIDFLRKMIEFAQTHKTAKEDEIKGLNADLLSYERHYIDALYKDFQGEKSQVSFEEKMQWYQLAKKFSRESKRDPKYVNIFKDVLRYYQLRQWGKRGIAFIGVLIVICSCSFLYKGHIQKCQEIRNAEIQKRQEFLLANITKSVGNTERYIQEIQKYLEEFPNETLNNQLENEIQPCRKSYETVLTFNRYWEDSLLSFENKKEFPKDFNCPDNIKDQDPSFIPEWNSISMYNSIPELIGGDQEHKLIDQTDKFFQEFYHKKEGEKVKEKKEWTSYKKDWSRCYYSNDEPVKENGRYRMTVTVPGSEKPIPFLFRKKPDTARYIEVARKRVKKLREYNGKKKSFCDHSKIFLDLLTQIAKDQELDPLYKTYFLTRVIMDLKNQFPQFYNYYLKEGWKQGEGNQKSLADQIEENDLHINPEDKKDRIIVDDETDNSRRKKAIVINQKISEFLEIKKKDPLHKKIKPYLWGGWIFNEKVLLDPKYEKKEGPLFVLKWEANREKPKFLPIGEINTDGMVLSQDLKNFDFQPVWILTDFDPPSPPISLGK